MLSQHDRQRIEAEVRAGADTDDTDEDVASHIAEAISDAEYDAACEAAEHRQLHGYPEDTPSLAHCDDAGTGEGRYHGRI